MGRKTNKLVAVVVVVAVVVATVVVVITMVSRKKTNDTVEVNRLFSEAARLRSSNASPQN